MIAANRGTDVFLESHGSDVDLCERSSEVLTQPKSLQEPAATPRISVNLLDQLAVENNFLKFSAYPERNQPVLLGIKRQILKGKARFWPHAVIGMRRSVKAEMQRVQLQQAGQFRSWTISTGPILWSTFRQGRGRLPRIRSAEWEEAIGCIRSTDYSEFKTDATRFVARGNKFRGRLTRRPENGLHQRFRSRFHRISQHVVADRLGLLCC